jgi:protein SCO1/2
VLAGSALALALALAGCGGDDAGAGQLHGSVVDPPFSVSSTSLVDLDGDRYSLTEDTDKRLTLVFFGYTNCPDICPLVLKNLASAMTRLDDADREQVDVVFVTTDPDRDTPEVMRRYLDHIDDSFIGLTGSLDVITAVGKSIAVGMGEKLPSGGYEVDAHTTQVTGIDSDDEAPVYWSQTTSPQQFADDIHSLLGGS